MRATRFRHLGPIDDGHRPGAVRFACGQETKACPPWYIRPITSTRPGAGFSAALGAALLLASQMSSHPFRGERSLKPGDRVRWTANEEKGFIRGIKGDLAKVSFSNGIRYIDVSELKPISEEPQDDLLIGRIGRAEPYGLRLQALYLKHAYRYDPCAGLSNARIEPALHQIYAANRVVSKNPRPRMILADEVGLGKTIEAGLVIKELRARGLIKRVLVITPASLTQQWRQELSSKFNEDFEVIDGAGVKFLSRDGGNPWKKRDNVICSLEFARKEKHTESITEAGWDLVVFDEAHRLRRRKVGKKTDTTRAYRLADQLKEQYGLLLLTATPMQLHSYELYSLIELVEPGLYSFEDYEDQINHIPELNSIMQELLRWDELDSREQTALRMRFPSYDLDNYAGRSEAEGQIIREHPFADILIRNRKAAVGGFTNRIAKIYPVNLTEEESKLYEDITDYIARGYDRALQNKQRAVGFAMVTYQKLLASSSYALYEGFNRRIERLEARIDDQTIEDGTSKDKEYDPDVLEDAREAEDPMSLIDLYTWSDDFRKIIELEDTQNEIKELKGLVDRLENLRDSKAQVLLRAMRDVSEQKILIFTQYIDTQEFLRQTLELNGYDVVVFNGNMNLDAKENAVQTFRTRSQILITTEAGGEGRNFQFSSTMFNYDLPWNPMKIEQRIGRLDRIGQKSDVHIYNLACQGTIEQRILDVLNKRIGLFEQSVGSLDPILGEIEKDIERLILTRDDEAFEEYVEDIGRKISQARIAESTWQNFVMDRASFRRDIANKIIEDDRMATPDDLKAHIGESLKFLGGWLSNHKEAGEIIQLPDKLIRKLNARQKVYIGIFDPQTALEHENLPFLAMGNPLIDSIVNIQLEAKYPTRTSFRVVDGFGRDVHLEVYYKLVTQGNPPFGVIIRHLIGKDGVLEEQRVKSMPQIGTDCNPEETPAWLSRAMGISRNAVPETRRRYIQEAQHHNSLWKQSDLDRETRIFEYKRARLEQEIKTEQELISSLEQYGTDGARRVLPARRGLLRRLEKRLNDLESDHEAAKKDIRDKPFSLSMKVLSAGLVKGP